MVDINEVDLLRLYDCSTTTRMGMVDKGFPITFARLEALGLVAPKNDGWVITEAGKATLTLNKHKLFPSKKKEKKHKEKYEDDYEWNEFD